MKKKTIFPIAMIAMVLTLGFVALRASGPVIQKDTCKESVDQCPLKKNRSNDASGPWDNLSRQFFSFSSSSY